MGICLFPLQSLAHWNGEGLLLPLTPRCLRRILKAKVPSAVSLLPMEAGCTQDARASEASRDELQAGGTGWVRAIWVAARQGRGRGCLILLLHWDHPFGVKGAAETADGGINILCMHDRPGMSGTECFSSVFLILSSRVGRAALLVVLVVPGAAEPSQLLLQQPILHVAQNHGRLTVAKLTSPDVYDV